MVKTLAIIGTALMAFPIISNFFVDANIGKPLQEQRDRKEITKRLKISKIIQIIGLFLLLWSIFIS